uniref:Bromo domain-containing protein n=1 Tax=Electrophorus electricus TaxID=8005 RepID=A0AAY5EAT7_ELEEL
MSFPTRRRMRREIHELMVETETECMANQSFVNNRDQGSPMWLDKVKDKLYSQKYETLRHFVSDTRLIFQNCNTFNRVRDKYSEYRDMEMFEQEFKTIFNIQ